MSFTLCLKYLISAPNTEIRAIRSTKKLTLIATANVTTWVFPFAMLHITHFLFENQHLLLHESHTLFVHKNRNQKLHRKP